MILDNEQVNELKVINRHDSQQKPARKRWKIGEDRRDNLLSNCCGVKVTHKFHFFHNRLVMIIYQSIYTSLDYRINNRTQATESFAGCLEISINVTRKAIHTRIIHSIADSICLFLNARQTAARLKVCSKLFEQVYIFSSSGMNLQ